MTRWIFVLSDSQGGKDQTIKYHLNRLKKGPEPQSRGWLLSLTMPDPHFSSMITEEALWMYLNFLFGSEKVLGQDSRRSIFFREPDDNISLKK